MLVVLVGGPIVVILTVDTGSMSLGLVRNIDRSSYDLLACCLRVHRGGRSGRFGHWEQMWERLAAYVEELAGGSVCAVGPHNNKNHNHSRNNTNSNDKKTNENHNPNSM